MQRNSREAIPAALNNHQAFGSSKLCLVGGWKSGKALVSASAGREGENMLRALRDSEFPHFGLEGRAFHAQASSGSGRPTDHPIRLLESSQDVLSLGGFQRLDAVGRGGIRYSQLSQGHMQVGSLGQDHSTLDEIFKLTDIARP